MPVVYLTSLFALFATAVARLRVKNETPRRRAISVLNGAYDEAVAGEFSAQRRVHGAGTAQAVRKHDHGEAGHIGCVRGFGTFGRLGLRSLRSEVAFSGPVSSDISIAVCR
jgi:hypothetical protein